MSGEIPGNTSGEEPPFSSFDPLVNDLIRRYGATSEETKKAIADEVNNLRDNATTQVGRDFVGALAPRVLESKLGLRAIGKNSVESTTPSMEPFTQGTPLPKVEQHRRFPGIIHKLRRAR